MRKLACELSPLRANRRLESEVATGEPKKRRRQIAAIVASSVLHCNLSAATELLSWLRRVAGVEGGSCDDDRLD